MSLGVGTWDDPMLGTGGKWGFGWDSVGGYAWGISNPTERVNSFYSPSENYFVPDNEPVVSIDVASFVRSLYQTYYHRAADPPGLEFWIQQIESGVHSRESARQAFATTPDMSPDSSKTLAQYLAQWGIQPGTSTPVHDPAFPNPTHGGLTPDEQRRLNQTGASSLSGWLLPLAIIVGVVAFSK